MESGLRGLLPREELISVLKVLHEKGLSLSEIEIVLANRFDVSVLEVRQSLTNFDLL